MLVVPQDDVVAGPVALDQVGLEDQRLELVGGDDVVEVGDVVDQGVRLGVAGAGGLEVGANPATGRTRPCPRRPLGPWRPCRGRRRAGPGGARASPLGPPGSIVRRPVAPGRERRRGGPGAPAPAPGRPPGCPRSRGRRHGTCGLTRSRGRTGRACGGSGGGRGARPRARSRGAGPRPSSPPRSA